jgi:hypothetical protein
MRTVAGACADAAVANREVANRDVATSKAASTRGSNDETFMMILLRIPVADSGW